jgi:hypothetical protein
VKSIRLAAFVIAIAAAAMSIGSAGAGTGTSVPTIDLSTAAAVNTYLHSIGVDPSTVVVQRGTNNYAGPFCPGSGWTCTTSTSVVQVASPGGQNQFECGDPSLFPESALTAPAAGYLSRSRCLAIQDAAAGTNTVDIRKSRDNGTALSCGTDVLQETFGGQNHFNCHLVIHASDSSQDPQTATEVATAMQNADGGGNHSTIDLEISLTSSISCQAATCSKSQNAWQRANVTQTASSGAENHSDVSETQYVRGRISGATTSNQSQNTDQLPNNFGDCNPLAPSTVSDPNSCAVVTQNGDGGSQESQLSFLNDLDVRTTATAGTQNQGCLAAVSRCSGVTTGLDGTVPQPAPGSTDKSREDYNERQDATAGTAGVPGVDQSQTAPQSCCALQTLSASNSLVNADQTSTQNASTSTAPLDALALSFPNPDASQITFLSGKIETDGSGTLDQNGRQDYGTASAGCTLPPPPGDAPLDESTPFCGSALFMVDGVALACDFGQIPTPTEGGLMCETPTPLE